MVKWEYKIGDKELKKIIQEIKKDFDECSDSEILSKETSSKHFYYKIYKCKSFEKVKEEFPYLNKKKCNFCDNYVEKWFEGTFSGLEYECGENVSFNICHKCIKDINKMEVTNNYLHKKDRSRNNEKNK